MKLLKKKALLIALFAAALAVPLAWAPASSTSFTVYIPASGNLAFQSTASQWVHLAVTTGTLNSSDSRVSVYGGGGYFKYTSNETCTITLSHATDVVLKVAGDSGNPFRSVANETVVTSAATNFIEIVWSISIEPYLPIMFLFGMIGLGSMFTGILWPIALAKERKYYEAGIKFVTFFFIGLGLFMGWVYL